jgi:hypothetical protein
MYFRIWKSSMQGPLGGVFLTCGFDLELILLILLIVYMTELVVDVVILRVSLMSDLVRLLSLGLESYSPFLFMTKL